MTITYVSSLKLTAAASAPRLRALKSEFEARGCQTRLDSKRGLLSLRVPGDLLCLIRGGGLARLVADYDDAVSWQPEFREARNYTRESRLPG